MIKNKYYIKISDNKLFPEMIIEYFDSLSSFPTNSLEYNQAKDKMF